MSGLKRERTLHDSRTMSDRPIPSPPTMKSVSSLTPARAGGSTVVFSPTSRKAAPSFSAGWNAGADSRVAGESGCSLVIHGPAVIDSGEVADLVIRLKPVRVTVAGVMARCAAEEHGLAACWTGERPSAALARDPRAVLVNRGRDPISGRVFGEEIVHRLSRPLVHIECSDRVVIAWAGADGRAIALRLGWPLEERRADRTAPDGNRRTIRGCRPGDPLMVDGLVIGRATAPEARLSSDGETIVAEAGCVVRAHGIEKLRRRGPINLPDAWCTAGTLRDALPRSASGRSRTGRILVLDHDAVGIYRGLADDVCGVLAIGDDTTAALLHLGVHLDLPVFGVTDGDGDGLVAGKGAAGSVVVRVFTERDDDLGSELTARLNNGPVAWDQLVADLLGYLGDRVQVVG